MGKIIHKEARLSFFEKYLTLLVIGCIGLGIMLGKLFPQAAIAEEEDHPFKLMDELGWLEEAGFCNVDVIWKYYFFTVYGGQKG